MHEPIATRIGNTNATDADPTDAGIPVAAAVPPAPERPGPASLRAERWTHAVILIAAVAVPVLGSLMVSIDSRRVAFAGWESAPLPTLCASRWIGFDCPTCGLTRSVISLMAGDLRQSMAFHRFGWLIFLLIVAQIPYRLHRLARPQRRSFALEKAGFLAVIVTAGLVLLNWIAEVALAW